MKLEPAVIHDDDIPTVPGKDRWGKLFIGGKQIPTSGGFCVGYAVYMLDTFIEDQTHDDQEALFVLEGVGEVRLNGRAQAIKPGSAVFVPPDIRHSVRRTGPQPVKVLYTHGAL